ncbi:MAG: glycosyltransferase [Candidatus Electrothrix sp. AW1]|nr:glycosyltransferase [Candidatus Electrothrix sp. AX1]MCI5181160.1 glycosyltransferase [Candidatus Electrothrix gigas]
MGHSATVLMSVFNGEKWIEEAIKSILCQSFSDFDFIIVNDNSTDSTEFIIRSFFDKRIILLQNDSNLGLPTSLNRGIDFSNSQYIIRMDADDISLPTRFEKQISYLDEHPHVGVCGSWIQTFGEKCEILKAEKDHKKIVTKLFFSNALFHPSVVIRREVLQLHKLRYESCYPGSEDYRFWVKLAEVTELANLQEVLLHYRLHPHQVTKKGGSSEKIRIELTEKLIGRKMNSSEETIHKKIFFEQGEIFDKDINPTSNWINKLIEENNKKKYYNKLMFDDRLLALKRYHYKKYLFTISKESNMNLFKITIFFAFKNELMKVVGVRDYSIFILSYLKRKILCLNDR